MDGLARRRQGWRRAHAHALRPPEAPEASSKRFARSPSSPRSSRSKNHRARTVGPRGVRAHVISRRSTTGPRFRRVRAGMGTFECTRHVPSSPGPSPLNTSDCCSMVIVVGSASGPRRCCQRRVIVGASAWKSQKSQLWALRNREVRSCTPGATSFLAKSK